MKKGLHYLEFVFAALILAGIVWVCVFFSTTGYLPPPFFFDTTDTFMDWYNTAHWVYRPSTYTVWGSIYPPISFIFLWMFSNPACYGSGGAAERDCDHTGIILLFVCIIVNIVLSYRIFRKVDPRTAAPRAIASGLGLPMLIAWERGNLILPCFTLFMLGHGRILKSAWARAVCMAGAINFKPYLVITIAGTVLRRRWRRAELFGLATLIIYLATFAVFGRGSPGEIFHDIFAYVYKPLKINFGALLYAQKYDEVLKILEGPFPIMNFIGSRPLELMDWAFPAASKLGEYGVLACFAGAVWRPDAVAASRLAALAMALVLTESEPGGYAQVFLFFLVFLDAGKGVSGFITLVATYLLCIPVDFQVVHLAYDIKNSYLSGHTVGYDLALTVGAIVRPGLLLILEYALVAGSLIAILRSALDGWLGIRPAGISNRRTRGGDASGGEVVEPAG